MPQYCITYPGGDQPSSPEEGKKHFSKYMDWLSSLGNSAVSPANPLKDTSTVNPDGSVTSGSQTSMSGFTIIETDSMESALLVAKNCPFLEIGGSLEVSELKRVGHSVFRWRHRGKYYLFTSHAMYLRDNKWDIQFRPGPEAAKLEKLRVDYVFPGYSNPDEDGFYRLNDQTKKSFSKALRKVQAG